MSVWNSAYEAVPTDSTYVADIDDVVRELKTNLSTRIGKEHGFNLTESSPQAGHGKHLRGTARAFVSDTDVADPTTVTADDADYATGRLQIKPTAKRLQFYTGSAWSEIVPSRSDSAGNADLASNSNLLNGYAGSASAVGNTYVRRDANGRAQVVHPSGQNDVATLYSSGLPNAPGGYCKAFSSFSFSSSTWVHVGHMAVRRGGSVRLRVTITSGGVSGGGFEVDGVQVTSFGSMGSGGSTSADVAVNSGSTVSVYLSTSLAGGGSLWLGTAYAD